MRKIVLVSISILAVILTISSVLTTTDTINTQYMNSEIEVSDDQEANIESSIMKLGLQSLSLNQVKEA